MLELICMGCPRRRIVHDHPWVARATMAEARQHCHESGHTVFVFDPPYRAFMFELFAETVHLERVSKSLAA